MADSDVEKIKEKLSIHEVVGQYVQLRRAGRTYVGRCPFHRERTPSFHVSPERGTYKCFGCGEGGDIFSFVEKIEGIDFRQALRELAVKAGVELKALAPTDAALQKKTKEKHERLQEVCEAAIGFFEAKLAERSDVKTYLSARGLSAASIEQWKIGYAPARWRDLSHYLMQAGFSGEDVIEAGLSIKPPEGDMYDRFRGRIMFPIFDASGKAIAFSGRFFEEPEGRSPQRSEPAKYVNSPETPLFQKSKVLYGLDRAKNAIRKADCILLVEGQFDLLLAHQSGLPFTVALSGTALTQQHLSLLGRFSKRLVLALDADQAGIRAGLKSAILATQQGFDVKVPTFPEGKDPADVAKESPELLKAAVRTSQTAIEFFLATVRRGARDDRAYKKLVEAQILPLVAALRSRIDQEHFIRLIAERLHVPEDAIRTELARRPVVHSDTEEETDELPAEQLTLPPFERKAAMLLFQFEPESAIRTRLIELMGAEKLKQLEDSLTARAEELRFIFDTEVGDHTSREAVAEDMLVDIERVVSKERIRMKFL